MTWILLDVLIALVALGVLAVLVLGLWRRVKALSRAVAAAGEAVGQATDALTLAQEQGPLGALPAVTGRPPGGSPQDRPRPPAGRSLGRSSARTGGARP